MRRVALTALLLLLAVSPLAAQEAPASFCIAAWLRESEQPQGFESLMNAAGIVDIVHPMWYAPADDGSILLLDDAEDPVKLAAWRDAGFQIVPSVFSTISLAIEETNTRARHVADLAALVERMDYAGLDIDYEEFRASTRDSFTAFIEELATALHDNGRTLTVTLQAKTGEPGNDPGSGAQDWARIAAAADRLTIMTYEYSGRSQPPGPISPPDWVVDVLDYAATVTDLETVQFGMPFYGYAYVRGNPPAQATTWSSIQPWIESFNVEIQRVPESGEALVDFKPPGLPRQVVVMNDGESVRARMEAVLAAHPAIGGLSIWGLGGEDPAVWDALAELRPADCIMSTPAG